VCHPINAKNNGKWLLSQQASSLYERVHKSTYAGSSSEVVRIAGDKAPVTDHSLILAGLIVGCIGLGVTGIGVYFGVGSFFYQRKQATIAEKDFTSRMDEQRLDAEWIERYEKLVRRLLRINPKQEVMDPYTKQTFVIFDEMFPIPLFRRTLLETVISLDHSGTRFVRKDLQPHELKQPYLRDKVAEAERYIAEFRKKHPRLPAYLGD
jgi:hypothetical protein